jgi:hypothetical protein
MSNARTAALRGCGRLAGCRRPTRAAGIAGPAEASQGQERAEATSWARSCMRPAGTATVLVVPATWRGTALYGKSPRARYFLGLDIYSNEPIPAAGGPA